MLRDASGENLKGEAGSELIIASQWRTDREIHPSGFTLHRWWSANR